MKLKKNKNNKLSQRKEAILIDNFVPIQINREKLYGSNKNSKESLHEKQETLSKMQWYWY